MTWGGEQRAKSKEQRAKSKEQRAKSKEKRIFSRELYSMRNKEIDASILTYQKDNETLQKVTPLDRQLVSKGLDKTWIAKTPESYSAKFNVRGESLC